MKEELDGLTKIGDELFGDGPAEEGEVALGLARWQELVALLRSQGSLDVLVDELNQLRDRLLERHRRVDDA